MTGTLGAASAGPESSGLAPVREGEVIADKYVIGPVLGVGGMGIVVLATDRLLERRVAIKFLLPSLTSSDKAVQRFIREARLATRITSEHVVRLLEIDTLPNGTPFFAMEYLEGCDLRAMMSERGPLSATEAVDYLMQALEAVAEGHQYGIVHRDLKPSNLFVAHRADGSPLVKVLDFGIAKTAELEGAHDMALTGSGDTRLGSPSYMSPEQLRSPNEVDVRSDVWALGVTIYELVCGRTPFQGKTYTDLVIAITTGEPSAPSQSRPDLELPPGFDQVVLTCLKREREQRYASVLELAAALAPFGTFDARTSLRRIRGLATAGTLGPSSPAGGTPSPITPRPVTPPRSIITATTPIGPERTRGDTRRSPTVPESRPEGARRPALLWVGLGVLVVLGLAWLGLSTKPAEAPPAVRVEPTAAERPAVPVSTVSVDTPPASVVASQPAPVVAPQPAPTVRETEVAAPAAAPSARVVHAGQRTKLPPTTKPEPSVMGASAAPSASSVEIAVPATASAEQPSGRSQVIERLIESRR